jgi:hypothetical protein
MSSKYATFSRIFKICRKSFLIRVGVACGEEENFLVGLDTESLQSDDDRDILMY